jgi:hypothetical protein
VLEIERVWLLAVIDVGSRAILGYTSHRLAQSPQLIGQSLRVFYDADDIRLLRAYLADVLDAARFARSMTRVGCINLA